MKEQEINDEIKSLFGILNNKPKKLTEEQKFYKAMAELSKKFPPKNNQTK